MQERQDSNPHIWFWRPALAVLLTTTCFHAISVCSLEYVFTISIDLGGRLFTLSRPDYSVPTSLPSALSVKDSTLSSSSLLLFPIISSTYSNLKTAVLPLHHSPIFDTCHIPKII